MRTSKLSFAVLTIALFSSALPVCAQQFNSDSYLSKPKGVVTVILTYGQRNAMIMNTFSLFERWEFTASAFLYDPDNDPLTDNGYSGSLYAKYMFFENEAKSGGWALKFGTGLDPGYLDPQNQLNDAFRTYWTNAPVTVPFLDNKLSWDIMPGISYTTEEGVERESSWAFTYATRLAWYPVKPTWALVGEVLGAEGEGTSPSEYRVGLRFEPNPHAVFAITYDDEFHGSNGAGFEIGMMLFTPPFFCGGKCK